MTDRSARLDATEAMIGGILGLADRRDPMRGAPMLSDMVAEQVRRLREERGMRRLDLAEKCAALGWPALTEGALGNIETGRRGEDGQRRREVTVDELFVLAEALDVAAGDLLGGNSRRSAARAAAIYLRAEADRIERETGPTDRPVEEGPA